MIASAKKSSNKAMWFISIVVVAVMCCLGYFAVKIFSCGDAQHCRRQVQTVTLVKPPPPQPPKEKPPEPEVQNKEEIVEPGAEETPHEESSQTQEDTPAGNDLGVDAEGSGGGDAFGLVGKKGGHSLIGGGGGGGGNRTLMQRYAWYTQMIQEEIRKKINEHLLQNGGLPEGDHKAMIKIVLDGGGRIVDYQLFSSSGDQRIDQALKATLENVQIGEAPPDGMPRSLRLKVSSRG